MKNTNGAISMLLSAFRAIYKNAYFRGLASAVVLSAAFAGAAQAETFNVTEDTISGFIAANEKINTSNDIAFASEEAYKNGTINNTTVNIHGSFDASKLEFEKPGEDVPGDATYSKNVSGFNAAGVDINGEYEIKGNAEIANAQINIIEGTNIQGLVYDYGDAGSGRTYLLAAGVWDGGNGGNSVSITNAQIHVAQGVKLDTVQLRGAVFDADSRSDSSPNAGAISGTVAGSVYFADAAEGKETTVKNAHITGVMVEEDEFTDKIRDSIAANGTVYVGQNVTVTGDDYEPEDPEDEEVHDVILGAYNKLGGTTNGSVTVNGSVSGTQISAAAALDSDIDGSVVIGSSGKLVMENVNPNQDMQLSAVSSSGKGGTLRANLEIYGQYGDAESDYADKTADIRVIDTEYFDRASAKVIINQSKEIAEKSKIKTVNIFNIADHETDEGNMPFTAENSVNSAAVVDVTIDGFSHVETLNLMHIEEGLDYSGTIEGTVTVGENAAVDTLNGIAAENSAQIKGDVSQTVNVYGTVKNLNLNGSKDQASSEDDGGDETAESVQTPALLSTLSASPRAADETKAEILTTINLYSGKIDSIAGQGNYQNFVDINSTGNSEIGEISSSAQVRSIVLDAAGAKADAPLLTIGSDITSDSIQVVTRDRQNIDKVIAGSDGQEVTVAAKELSISSNGLTQTVYKMGDNSIIRLGNGLSVKNNDLALLSGKLVGDIEGVVSYGTATSGSKLLGEAMAGTAALVNQGAEFIASTGIDAAAAAVARSSGHNSAFGAVQAGYSEYDTGSEVELTSVSGIVGFAKGFSFGSGMLTAAVFLDLGHGSSDLYAAGYSGDADHNYYGLGAAVRYTFANGFFLDGSLRGGKTETDFNGDIDGNDVDYDADAAYFGAHIGGGYVFNLTDSMTLTPYLRGTFSWIDDDSVHTANGAELNLDSVSAYGLQAGADLGYALTDMLTLQAGIGYIGVWNGDADLDIDSISADAPTIEGNTGMARIGLKIAPQGSGFSLDIGAAGYAGDRKGGMGSLMINYAF